jgi:hypothetical protein
MVGQLPWGIVRPFLSVAGHAEGTHSRLVLLLMESVPAGYSVLVRAMALVRMGLAHRRMLFPSLLSTSTLVIPSAPSRLTTPFMFSTRNDPGSAPFRFLTPHMSLMPGALKTARLYPYAGSFPVIDRSWSPHHALWVQSVQDSIVR